MQVSITSNVWSDGVNPLYVPPAPGQGQIP